MSYQYIVILCEGQSEESVVKRMLAPYLEPKGIYIQPIVLGGVSHYARIRKELLLLGKNSSIRLTTMLDYYKLPQDVPGVCLHVKETIQDPEAVASDIEQSIWQDLQPELNCMEFFPYIQMHEYEALLFSEIDSFSKANIDSAAIAELKKEVKKFSTPEHINNSEQTAPSKRILRVYPQYQKILDGTRIAESIGLETMMEKCPHFAHWVKKLETGGTSDAAHHHYQPGGRGEAGQIPGALPKGGSGQLPL